jgi:hypothetical protein
MLADLTNVATKSGEPISAIVRQAIRNYLDGTDLTLGTRRTCYRRFEKRIAEMEASLKQERLQRVPELYLAGDITRSRYLEEKWSAQVALASLHPLPKDAIMAAGSYLQDFDHRWLEAHSFSDNARLLRLAIAAAFVKGRSLVAVGPTGSFFPLMHYCWSGSDGDRSRDHLSSPAQAGA